MRQLEKDIQKYQEQAAELADVKEDVFDAKADLTITAVGILLTKLNNSINELFGGLADAEYYDKNLGETLKETVTELAVAFSKIQPPTINVTHPNINVDLKPIQNAFTEIGKQNQSMLGLMEKMYNGNKSDELYRLIVALVSKQNIFLEKSFQQIDIRPDLKSLNEIITKNRVEKLTVKREDYGNRLITEVIPVYKK